MMMVNERLIDLTYDGAVKANSWLPLLHELRVELNSVSSALVLEATQNLEKEYIANSDTSLYRQPDSFRKLYHKYYYKMNPIRYSEMQRGKVYNICDFIKRDKFKRTSYYQEYFHAIGLDDTLTAYVGELNGVRAWLCVARGDDLGAYKPRDAALMHELIPHLHRALKISGMLSSLHTGKVAYRDSLDRMKLCTVLLSGDGRVLEMNGQAEELINSSENIAIIEDEIFFRDSVDNFNFRSLLSRISSGDTTANVGSLKVGRMENEAIDLVLRRMSNSGESPRATSSMSAILYLKKRREEFDARHEVVAEMYGLTPTEARLAIAITSGASIRESASSFKMTEQTVRTYVKRILHKTGTRRQSELVRMVGSGLATML